MNHPRAQTRNMAFERDAPNTADENRVAFRASSVSDVDRLAAIAIQAGARHVEGPAYEDDRYYAVLFEDPCGNRLEICCRTCE